MRPILLACLLAACHAPDRWNASVSKGKGEIDGDWKDFDTTESRLEIGVSGPLFTQDAPKPPPCPKLEPAAPPVSHEESLPWGDIALVLAGIGGYGASHVGYRTYKKRRAT